MMDHSNDTEPSDVGTSSSANSNDNAINVDANAINASANAINANANAINANANAIKLKRSRERITLLVGERRFNTFRDTLTSGSQYFAARLSGRWSDADEDGSYFVDADPSIFEHILCYLRTGHFPLFFDSSTLSFDHAKYMALLSQARYFGIKYLMEFIERRQYIGAIRVTRTVEIIEEAQSVNNELFENYLNNEDTPDAKVEITTTWHTKQVYICPRNIDVHRGYRDRCGRACEAERDRQGGAVVFKEEKDLRAVVTSTTVDIEEDRLGLY
ncbi:BTB/POZ protein [Hypoxylon sp. NC1633]|nr:BTB/POZ protein [Hypoxylon sp. NC1633]